MKAFLLPIALFIFSTSSWSQDEANTFVLPDYPRVAVETTSGNFILELYTERAPLTVTNFVQNVLNGFYEGIVFHRIVGGFVVQGGGYNINYERMESDKMIPNESGNGLSNRRGSIAMARSADPHSANTQFYINLADNLPLDPRPTRWGYAVFGRVIEGMEIMDEIGYVATGPGPVPELVQDVPKEPIVIISMKLLPEEAKEVVEVEEVVEAEEVTEVEEVESADSATE